MEGRTWDQRKKENMGSKENWGKEEEKKRGGGRKKKEASVQTCDCNKGFVFKIRLLSIYH